MATVPFERRKPLSADIADKLPQNLEAERCILGAILLDNAALDAALKAVRAEDFFLPQHKVIFRAMLALQKAGRPIDTALLCEGLGARQQLDAAGGVAYITQLPDGLPRVSNTPHYAEIVAQKSLLRQTIYDAHDVQAKAFEPGADLAALQKQLAAASARRGQSAIAGNGHAFDYSLMDFMKAEFPAPEELIEGLVPRGGSVMIVAMPHHLKSWFTVAMALGSTAAGTLMGHVNVPKPVRTFLASVEDFPGQLQWRIRQLLTTSMYAQADPSLVRILPRPPGGIDIMDEACFQRLLRRIEDFKADHIIFDVMRRVFRGDINSPKESAALCEQFDRLRDATGAALTVVHHENRKEADIMRASAGSFNLPGWANVVIQFKRKGQQGAISTVEIEVDNKLAQSPEPARMVLDLGSETPVRLEAIEDSSGVDEIREKLGVDWTVRDLCEALDVHKSNAQRRLNKLLRAGIVEKLTGAKRGRMGGMARYCFVADSSSAE